MVAKNTNQGFTMIEVMLFLAVTGLLFVTLMFGISTAVGRERYNDSVHNLEEILKEQYSLAANTQGRFEGTSDCLLRLGGDNPRVEPLPDGNQDPGRTQCLIYGRVIHFRDRYIITSTLVGADPRNQDVADRLADAGNSNVRHLQLLGLSSFGIFTETQRIAWDATPRPPRGGNNNNADWSTSNNTIVIARSPMSGTTMTFVGRLNTNTDWSSTVPIHGLISVENLQRGLEICVDGSNIFGGRTRAVVVAANGSGPAAVSIAPLDVAVGYSGQVRPVECG